jgi:hypothetical protein
MGNLVEVTTWGTVPWEFANFTDAELATAITHRVALPPGVTRPDLLATLKAQREIRKTNPQRSPNVEAICRTWPPQHRYRKVELAEELWPRLREKVRRDVATGGLLRLRRPGGSPSTPDSAQLLPPANCHARAITSRQDCAGQPRDLSPS